MVYRPDFSDCPFGPGDIAAKSVGWLERGHPFDTAAPSEDTLDVLWSFCLAAPIRTRGGDYCDLCPTPQTVYTENNGIRLLLGTSEIVVFAKQSDTQILRRRVSETEFGALFFFRGSAVPFSIFVAPTLIYHYVAIHHYKPPVEFLRALEEGPRPPHQEYFDLVKTLQVE